jgi:thiamine-phosphate pyrophosphorylase
MTDERSIRPAYSAPPTIKHRQPGAPLLYYITDRHQLASTDPTADERLETRILHAARAGIDYIQLREKDLSSRALEELAYEAMAAVDQARRDAGSETRLLINGRVDIAIACGAAGVHLPSENALSPDDARVAFEKAGVRSPIIAVSCHTADDVARAASRGANFAVFGPVFGKGPDAVQERVEPAGVEALRSACAASLGMPVFALGAVTVRNAADCLRAGAGGIAGIRLFQQGDVATTIEELRHIKP